MARAKYEIKEITPTELLLDGDNPRLPDPETGQQQIALALAEDHVEHLLTLAQDIVENGMDPLALPGVIPASAKRKKYRVIEGNRRVLALKALESPGLISPLLTQRESKRLNGLAADFSANPIPTVYCAVFATESAAVDHWLELRHTGLNGGAGLLQWGSPEQSRFRERHTGSPSPASQILEFVKKHGVLSDVARESNKPIFTTVERVLTTPEAREAFGVDVVNGRVTALYGPEELARSLGRLVEDLRTEKVVVKDLYTAEDRKNYAKSLPRAVRPKASGKLTAPVYLEDLTKQRAKPGTAPRGRGRGTKTEKRTTVIPKNTVLEIDVKRIGDIRNELGVLSPEQYPNACSILLRVFLELSVDDYAENNNIISDADLRSWPLVKRLTTVAEYMKNRKIIPASLFNAVKAQAVGGKSVLAPSMPTFNLYVHNQYVWAKPQDLYDAWDAFWPFVEKIWAKS